MSPDRVIPWINGPRGTALLSLGVFALPHALAYSPLTQPPAGLPLGLSIMGDLIPIPVYGALWGVCFLLCWVAGLAPRRTPWRDYADRGAFGLLVFLCGVWAVAFLGAWVLYHVDGWGWLDIPAARDSGRAYFNGLVYLGIAGAVAAATRMSNPTRTVRGRRLAGVRLGGHRR